MPSWSSTTKAAARIWSWSSASCAGGGAATSSVSRWRRRVRRSSSALLREQLDIDADDVYRRAGPARSARADGPRPICRVSTRCAIRRCSRSTCSPRLSRRDLFSVLDERDVLLHHPYECLRPGGRARSRRPPTTPTCSRSSRRCIARAPARRSSQPAARRRAQQAGDRARRADGAVRRGAQHPVGARARGGGRARDLRRPRLQDAREDLPDRQAHAAGAAALRASRHRQLQRADGAHLHGLRPADDIAGDRRGRDRVLQRADRLFGSAAAEEAGDGADRPSAALPQADRSRAPAGRGGPAGGDRRQDELAHRRGDHRGAVRRVAGAA